MGFLGELAGSGRRFGVRQKALALALALATGVFLYLRLRPAGPDPRLSSARTERVGGGATELPRIDLGRLGAPASAAGAGRRDLFEFGSELPGAEDDEGRPDEPPPAVIPVLPRATPEPEPLVPPPPRLAAINLKYIGSLEAKGGPKVAVLLTDRNEILYGQVGQQLANRFKILRIGFESVEVLDEGSGQSRRIPLRGN